MSFLRRLCREALPIALVLLASVAVSGLTAWTVSRWPPKMELVTSIVQLLAGVATIVVAVVAVWALTTWRREHLGRQKIDLASEALALFLEVEAAIRSIRSPFGYAGVSDQGTDREELMGQITRERGAFLKRYREHEAKFARLQSLSYRFRAVFGEEHAEPFGKIRIILAQLILANDDRYSNRLHLYHGRGHTDEVNAKLAGLNHTLIWRGADDDKIADRVKDAVKKIEEVCQEVTNA